MKSSTVGPTNNFFFKVFPRLTFFFFQEQNFFSRNNFCLVFHVSVRKIYFINNVWKVGFQFILILGLLGIYFDAVVVFVMKSSLFFRLAVAILCTVVTMCLKILVKNTSSTTSVLSIHKIWLKSSAITAQYQVIKVSFFREITTSLRLITLIRILSLTTLQLLVTCRSF